MSTTRAVSSARVALDSMGVRMSFTKGQRVHVEFDGILRATSSNDDENEYLPAGQGFTDNHGGWRFVEVEDTKHAARLIWVNGDFADPPGPEVIETVGPEVPENWPPQTGDIWRDELCEYFVTRVHEGIVEFMHNISTDEGVVYGKSDTSLSIFAGLQPELARRVDS
jgi:hypothetical protein